MAGIERDPVVAYIGLGANIGDCIRTLRSAKAALAALADTRLERCSSLYRSAPVGDVDQPDFINAVCRLQTKLPADALMQQLLEIERRHHRRRAGPAGGPRSLDLDLLLYADAVIDRPGLVVPHPRLHERAFVLYPLSELDPEITIPGQANLATLLRACTGQRLERLADAL